MGMALSPALFDRQLRQMGQAVEWRRSFMCPCRDPHSGQAEMGCPSCGGRGFAWAAPVPAWTGVVSQRIARNWGDFSAWEAGDEALTIPGASPLFAAGEYDRIAMLDSSEPFQVVLDRDEAPRVPVAVASLERCHWLRPGDRMMVEASLPVVGEGGALSWPAGDGPDPGARFTLRGRKRPEFFVFKDLPQDRAHFGGLPLPRRVIARKFDLFGR